VAAEVPAATGVASAGYRWYLGAQALSLAGTTMSYTALFWLALRIPHGGAAALAAVDAAQCLPMLLFSRRAGLLVARYRAAGILVITQTLQVAGALAIGVPLLAGWMTIWYLVPLSLALGCVLCVDLPARQTFMLDLIGPAELRRGTSLFATVTGLARIVGPGIAGIVIAASGETAVFFVDAASFLAVIAVLTHLSRKTAQPGTTAQPGQTQPGTAAKPGNATDPAPGIQPEAQQAPVAARRFRWLADLPPDVRAAAAMALLVGGFGWQFAVTNPLIAARVFGLGSAGFGLFGTCAAVGGIAGNYWSSHREDPGPREFLAWAVVFGVTEGLAAVMPSAWLYDAAMVVTGATLQLFAVSATVYIQQATPAAQRGLALSAYNAGFIGFVPAGAFVVAAIASTAGVRWALIGPGLAIAICATALLTRRPRPGRARRRRTRHHGAQSVR
jgi:transmembrane secretion effector